MYCTECGTKNEDGMQFCVQCGAPLDSSQVDLSSQPLEPTQPALGNRLRNVSTTRRSRQPKKRTRIIVAAMIAALVACGGASYYQCFRRWMEYIRRSFQATDPRERNRCQRKQNRQNGICRFRWKRSGTHSGNIWARNRGYSDWSGRLALERFRFERKI